MAPMDHHTLRPSTPAPRRLFDAEARRWLSPCLVAIALGTGACSSTDSKSSSPAGGAAGLGGGAGVGTGGDAGSAGAATGGTGGVVTASCPEGYPMGDVSGKPLINVMIGGKGPYQFVYDTGAPTSGIDAELYDEVGAGPYALEIAGQSIEQPLLPVVPTAAVGIPGVSGIIGGDVMESFAVTLDFERKRFWLEPARDEAALLGCSHAQGAPVDVPYEHGYYLFVPGTMDGKSGWLLVDSGASLGGVPESVFDEIDAAAPRPALEGFYTPAAIGTFWSRLSTLGKIDVAGQSVEHLVIRTLPDGSISTSAANLDGPFLGLLPTDYLKHFLVTVDYPNQSLRLDRYTDLEPREPTRFFAAGIGLEKVIDPPVHVAQLLPGSSAEEQGVLVGDEVTNILGHPIGTLSTYQRPWGLVAGDDGASIPIEVDRAGQKLPFSLKAKDLLSDP